MRWNELRLHPDAPAGPGSPDADGGPGAHDGSGSHGRPGAHDGAGAQGTPGTTGPRGTTAGRPGGQPGTAAPALFERGAITRSFDTPGFRGMTFFEVHARSVINRVPDSSRVPFRWTINPYRGCSHACVYCLGGETPILMADGRTKPLAEVRPGDEIYGTVRRGSYRRYVRTTVLAHWQTVKPAYRITLEDGTRLITSGDHRFLSDRGWKHVTGAESGPLQRPHLTTNNKLMGVGGSPRATQGRCRLPARLSVRHDPR